MSRITLPVRKIPCSKRFTLFLSLYWKSLVVAITPFALLPVILLNDIPVSTGFERISGRKVLQSKSRVSREIKSGRVERFTVYTSNNISSTTNVVYNLCVLPTIEWHTFSFGSFYQVLFCCLKVCVKNCIFPLRPSRFNRKSARLMRIPRVQYNQATKAK